MRKKETAGLFLTLILFVAPARGCNGPKQQVDCGHCEEVNIRHYRGPALVRSFSDGTTSMEFFPTLEACQEVVNACNRCFNRR